MQLVLVKVISFQHLRGSSVRMTIIAGSTVIAVSSNTLVFVIHLRAGMAGRSACEFRIIGRILMAIRTRIPLSVMLS